MYSDGHQALCSLINMGLYDDVIGFIAKVAKTDIPLIHPFSHQYLVYNEDECAKAVKSIFKVKSLDGLIKMALSSDLERRDLYAIGLALADTNSYISGLEYNKDLWKDLMRRIFREENGVTLTILVRIANEGNRKFALRSLLSLKFHSLIEILLAFNNCESDVEFVTACNVLSGQLIGFFSCITKDGFNENLKYLLWFADRCSQVTDKYNISKEADEIIICFSALVKDCCKGKMLNKLQSYGLNAAQIACMNYQLQEFSANANKAKNNSEKYKALIMNTLLILIHSFQYHEIAEEILKKKDYTVLSALYSSKQFESGDYIWFYNAVKELNIDFITCKSLFFTITESTVPWFEILSKDEKVFCINFSLERYSTKFIESTLEILDKHIPIMGYIDEMINNATINEKAFINLIEGGVINPLDLEYDVNRMIASNLCDWMKKFDTIKKTDTFLKIADKKGIRWVYDNMTSLFSVNSVKYNFDKVVCTDMKKFADAMLSFFSNAAISTFFDILLVTLQSKYILAAIGEAEATDLYNILLANDVIPQSVSNKITDVFNRTFSSKEGDQV